MKVLVAVDDSAQAQGVVDTLAPWLARTDAEVHLLTVVDVSHLPTAMRGDQPGFETTPFQEQPPPQPAEGRGQAVERVVTEHREALMTLADSMEGVIVEVHAVGGDKPAQAIAEEAKRLGADMVAVGTHGRSGLSRALMGSVAEDLIRRSDVPVLVVREGMRTLPA